MNSFITDYAKEGISFHTGFPTADAVGYTRYSSLNQKESSTAYQTEAIINYCKTHNIRLHRIYSDEAISGTSDKRPSFQAMISDTMSTSDWDTIIVFDSSRFARNTYDAMKYSRIFEDNDITLISATEDFGKDPTTAFLMRVVTFTMDDMSSKNNSRKTHAGMMLRAKEGKRCGAPPPLGYDVVDGRLQINNHEAEAVRLIFDMYEMGYTYPRIAEKLNERGYRNKYGQPFIKSSFSSILSRSTYTGVFSWNKASKKNSYGKRNSHKQKPLSKQVIIEDACPVIIEPKQFARVQELMKNKLESGVRLSNKHHYMLSGLKRMVCAECGAYMVGTLKSSHGKEYFVYTCPNHRKKTCSMKEVRADVLNKMVAGNLVSDLYTRGDLHKIVSAVCYDKRYYLLKDTLKGKEDAIKNTMKALESGCTEEIVAKLRQIRKEKLALQAEIQKYEADMASLTSGGLKELAKEFGNTLMTSDEPEIRAFLAQSIASIIVDHEDISITLNIA